MILEPDNPEPMERPERTPRFWPDWIDRQRRRWFPYLPHQQPGMPFPQPPGAEEWDDTFTYV